MTYDLYFWPSGAAKDIAQLADRLAGEEADDLAPDPRVLAFRAELLRRWPDHADRIEPWHPDLEWRRPSGRTDLADRYVLLTLPYSWYGTGALPALAGWYGLDCYDPQADQVVTSRLRLRASDGDGFADVTEVEGQVADDHVIRLCQQVSGCIGYRFDHLDEAAFDGALDDETSDTSFEYPLMGTPPLSIRLSRSPGGTAVAVRVEGDMDLVLATRIESIVDLL